MVVKRDVDVVDVDVFEVQHAAEQLAQRELHFHLGDLRVDTGLRVAVAHAGQEQRAGQRAADVGNRQLAVERTLHPRQREARPGLRVLQPQRKRHAERDKRHQRDTDALEPFLHVPHPGTFIDPARSRDATLRRSFRTGR